MSVKLTDTQIRIKLKHIGGLCYALAMDMTEQMEQETRIKAECESLRTELNLIKTSTAYRKAKCNEASKRSKARKAEVKNNN